MSDHIAYALHVATEEMVGRMVAAEKRVKELETVNLGLTKTLVELEAENVELRGTLWRFIQESEHGGGTIDEKSRQGIRMALDALFEQPADDEGEA